MSQRSNPIGVLDSGVGGITVVRELRKMLPGEDIAYCADSDNCPFGNRTQEDIVGLTNKMLTFLQEKQVKMILVACNTISALWNHYGEKFPFPIVSIISPMAKQVAERGLCEVGLVATSFTVNSGAYEKAIKQHNLDVKLYSKDSKNLAVMVENGDISGDDTREEVRWMMSHLLAKQSVGHVILGCTHYPVVEGLFQEAAPDVTFLNPAVAQVTECERLLAEKNLLSDGKEGKVEVYTSGAPEVSKAMLTLLGITGFTVHGVDSF